MSLPSSMDDLTPQWLTTVLATSGALAAGQRIASVERRPLASGVGLTSDLFRVSYRLETGERGSVVVKLAADNELRSTVDTLELYRREVDFYRRLAGRVPLRTPRVHLALQDEGSTDFVLVLEDLRCLTGCDQLAGLGVDGSEVAIDAAARFHAWGWQQPSRLAELESRFPSIRNELTRTMYPTYFEAGWASYRCRAAREPGPALRAVAEGWVDALPSFLDALAQPATLCHGDYRADNLFLDADGSLVVIDFQLVHQGCGISDIAYLVSQSVEGASLEDHRALVRRYCQALERLGVAYPFAEAWCQYRVGVMFNLVTAVVTTLSWPSLDDRGRRLVLRLVERAGEAIEATKATSLLA